MIAQPSLVAAQPLGDLVGRRVEGGVCVGGLAMALNHDAASDVNQDVGPQQMCLAGEHYGTLNGVVKVLGDGGFQGFLDVASQGAADIDLFARHGKLHE